MKKIISMSVISILILIVAVIVIKSSSENSKETPIQEPKKCGTVEISKIPPIQEPKKCGTVEISKIPPIQEPKKCGTEEISKVLPIQELKKVGAGETSKQRPFQELKLDGVEKVEVLLQPPNIKAEITDSKQLQSLIDILNKVVIYENDNSWGECNGQYVQYTITKKNGEIIAIGAYNPFLIIDGVGYKTEYYPCEDLNQLANSIIGK